MRYQDGPTTEVALSVRAPIEVVWDLVTDIDLPARFSEEFLGARWLDDQRGPGARFLGSNQHSALGSWQTISYVVRWDPPHVFAWNVGDPDEPSASWWFELVTDGTDVLIRYGARIGPARSGLSFAIDAMPDKEERIIARRLEEFRRNMSVTVDGIKAVAEGVGVTLRLGIALPSLDADGMTYACEAERLGVDSAWSAEFWGGDALTPLAYLAARTSTLRLGTGIVQLGARTPTMLAMSAMSMQALSGGRFLLGLGTSGPQVMEGWHGVSFDRPVRRTRETIEIIRAVAAGSRLEHRGEVYQLPLPDGAGRPIRSALAPTRVPVYVASLGQANLRLTGELADGWLGNSFLPESAQVFLGPLTEGVMAAGRSLADLDLTVAVSAELTEDVEGAGRRHADGYAFTFGAMGSRTRNFYNEAFTRQGYGEDVRAVQELWLAGDREAAARRVPIEIGLHTNLIGDDETVRERLRRYREVGIDTLRLTSIHGADLGSRLATLGRLCELVMEVNAETGSGAPESRDPLPDANAERR